MTMGLSGIVMLITVLAISETVSLPSSMPSRNQTDNYYILYLMEQVLTIKPRIASLEDKIISMGHTIDLQKKQIEALKDRKGFRCESGTLGYDKHPGPIWPYRKSVKFHSSFTHPPKVTHCLYLLDSVHSKNLRVHAEVNNVTYKSFQVLIKTWADSELYGAYISWMACGY